MDINGPVNILVVDDDEAFLAEFKLLIEDRLRGVAGRVDLAKSVSNAKQLFGTNSYDLIIADIDFADVGESPDQGLEILGLRKVSPHLVVVLTTGKADSATVFRGAKEGAWDFFPKEASIEGEVVPRLYMAIAKVKSERRIQRLKSSLGRRESQVELYRKTIFTGAQFVLSVTLAILTLLASARSIESNIHKTAIFFGVLLFSAVFFEFLKRFVVKIGGLEISAGSEERVDDGDK